MKRERQASVLVCDDLLFSLNGKMTAIGIYTADLIIPTGEHRLNQLVFLFVSSGDLQDVPKTITYEVTLPGEEAKKLQIPTPSVAVIPEGRKSWYLKIPFLVQGPTLRPGRIAARIVFDDGEIPLAAPWIVKADQSGGAASSNNSQSG